MPTNSPYEPPDELPDRSSEELAFVIANREEDDDGSAYSAFEELHNRYTKLLKAYIAARAPSREVDDLLQQVWLKTWNKAGQFNGGKFQSWLYQIARNTMIDWHRRRKETHSIDESGIAKHDDPTQPMLDQERMQALKDCMESLSEREASVVRRLLAGESYQQICRRLEVNSNVAYKTARIAKTKLRTCVEHKLA